MKAAILRTVNRFGEPVEVMPMAGGNFPVMASVQLPLGDALVNDYDLTGFLVYIPESLLPAPPTKFDRIKVRGIIRGIEDVQEENLSGELIVYILRVRG